METPEYSLFYSLTWFNGYAVFNSASRIASPVLLKSSDKQNLKLFRDYLRVRYRNGPPANIDFLWKIFLIRETKLKQP
ncbi:hypothetical protein CLV58_109120 [Spirosoma oryzae]|uniref:Uncharacterized protein n=1 Tax=Spirosoma oryzae TaxID=1469603 RepID=A0A2T0SYF3_9BACT|nr:hypothetical protein CLV58_109120 [Spirosoma oryzae]